MRNKEEAEEGPIEALVIGVISFGVLYGISLLILRKFQEKLTDSTAISGVEKAILALHDVGTWVPAVILVAVAGIIVAYVRGVQQQGSRGTY
jgi:type II secretory pathway component PulF